MTKEENLRYCIAGAPLVTSTLELGFQGYKNAIAAFLLSRLCASHTIISLQRTFIVLYYIPYYYIIHLHRLDI